MRLSLLSLAPAFALAQSQVYFSPAPPSSAPAEGHTVSQGEAESLVAHHLGLARFQPYLSHLPSLLQSVFSSNNSPFESEEARDSLVVLYHGPKDALPAELDAPQLRLARGSVHDWQDYFGGLLSQAGGFMEDRVQRVGKLWQDIERKVEDQVTLPVEPKDEYTRLLSQFDFHGPHAQGLLEDFEQMSHLVDQQTEGAVTASALLLNGLNRFEAKETSHQRIQEARKLYQQFLEATLAAFKSNASPASKAVLIQVPPSSSPTNARNHHAPLKRRQLSSAASHSTPIVPVSKQCYDSIDSCDSSTNSCSGHGQCVSAIQAGQQCYACSCAGGSWAGETCEKEMVASSFWLLTGSTVLLIVVVGVSVGLLSGAGSEELPQVLSQ